jgi:hypothetical protein
MIMLRGQGAKRLGDVEAKPFGFDYAGAGDEKEVILDGFSGFERVDEWEGHLKFLVDGLRLTAIYGSIFMVIASFHSQ